VITDQLVNMAQSPEEIMAVLAHEIGHVELRHALRQVLQDSVVLAAATALSSASLNAKATGLPVTLAQARYSRDFETQADDYAFALLKRHGISPSRFADILERLENQRGRGQAGATFLDSHPATPERIRRARSASPAAS
jgi:predicted Zn-dependent protease